ncbi:MAG TPA: N-acetyltransferase [Dongiaceae bacterium]|nr:N-acetyltransferase [Dongiaceae bacterium]
MEVDIRTARPDDLGPIAELMYSSGPEVYDFLYKTRKKSAVDFIRYEFSLGSGFCGYHNVTVAVQGNKVVGTGCFYDRAVYEKLMMDSGKNFFGFFGLLGALPVLWRSRHVGSTMKPPKEGELYLANFGVDPNLRSQGIGSRMIRHKIDEAKRQGYTIFGLDVAVTNPRGQALYTRLGLEVKKEKVFSGNDPNVPACRKMELAL